ncbi:MAG: hypothetical protein AAF694_24090 [Bacteroidota bacterium]
MRYRNYSLLFLMLGCLLTGCENRLFELTIYPYFDQTFIVSESFRFDEAEQITEDKIENEIDLSEDAEIKTIEISAVRIIVTPQSGNEAEEIDFEAQIITPENDVIPMLDQNAISVKLPTESGEELVFTDIRSEAVLSMRQTANEYFTGFAVEPFVIRIQGETTDPSQENIRLNVNVVVDFSVVYEECIEVPTGAGGEECNS